MKRALFRYLRRYLHVLVTGLVIMLALYVFIMQQVALTSTAEPARGLQVDGQTQVVKASLSSQARNVTLSPLEVGQKISYLLAGVPRANKSYLTIGIPTLKRPKGEYFFSTLASLLRQSTPSQHQNMTLVIMLADRNPDNNRRTLDSIKANYSPELREGVILVVSAPDTEHIFRARNLKRTFNDSLERVRWRSKQNLDYAALMEISARFSTYYLQIEDDVTAAPNYIQHIQTFVRQNARQAWAGLEVCPHGFIGKLFRTSDLPKLVTILRTFYLEMPCDFLIGHFYRLMLQNKVIRRKGNLFFHQGKYSSLANVTRKTDPAMTLKTRAPVSKSYRYHRNPPADLYTSIAVYLNYKLTAAYDLAADGFFWGKEVKDGDDVTVIFRTPQHVSRILVNTGIMDKDGTRRDFIRNGTVEVGERAYVGNQGRKALCTDTKELGIFVRGRFNQSLPDTPDTVRCFTIVITQAQKDWVTIPEIVVFTRKS